MSIGALQKSKFSVARLGVALLLPLASLSLAACGDAAEEAGAGGLNPQDAAALDEAAAKLDAENAAVPVAAPTQTSVQPAQPASPIPAAPEQKPAPQNAEAAAPAKKTPPKAPSTK